MSVGNPVEGAPLIAFTTTIGTSVIAANPIFSFISDIPGPAVAVITFSPVQEAPIIAAIEPISSSISMNLPPS